MTIREELVIAIQARTSSARYPGKVLKSLNGISIIERTVNNCKKTGLKVIVLTSVDKSDDELVNYLQHKEIQYFRGSLNNLHLRYFEFMEKNQINNVVRISGDSPLIHPDVINMGLNCHMNTQKKDITTNLFPRTFPKGQSVEIFSRNTIKKIDSFVLSRYNQEHLTSHIYENSRYYEINNFTNKEDLSRINLCIDIETDKVQIENFLQYLSKNDSEDDLNWSLYSNAIKNSEIFK